MPSENSELVFVTSIFETEQMFASQNEIIIPTHYGALLIPGEKQSVVTGNIPGKPVTEISNSKTNKSVLKSGGIYHCGVISVLSAARNIKILAHAPTPNELREIADYLLSENQDNQPKYAKLYVNPQKAKSKTGYGPIYEDLCKKYKLVPKSLEEVDENFQVII